MLNQQPIEPRVKSDGDLLSLHSLFRTIQGEGPFSGRRAVFIRLAGCNLACPKCDTDYTEGRGQVTVATLLNKVCSNFDESWLVVITGGEPFRQNIEPLVRALVTCGYTVQVETNGVLPLPSVGFPEVCSKDTSTRDPACFIVCSPKTNKVHPSIEAVACAYKYVLTDGSVADDGLPTRVLENESAGDVARPPKGVPVYVQPADEKNTQRNLRNLNTCIDASLEHGYVAQIQLHKYLGVA